MKKLHLFLTLFLLGFTNFIIKSNANQEIVLQKKQFEQIIQLSDNEIKKLASMVGMSELGDLISQSKSIYNDLENIWDTSKDLLKDFEDPKDLIDMVKGVVKDNINSLKGLNDFDKLWSLTPGERKLLYSQELAKDAPSQIRDLKHNLKKEVEDNIDLTKKKKNLSDTIKKQYEKLNENQKKIFEEVITNKKCDETVTAVNAKLCAMSSIETFKLATEHSKLYQNIELASKNLDNLLEKAKKTNTLKETMDLNNVIQLEIERFNYLIKQAELHKEKVFLEVKQQEELLNSQYKANMHENVRNRFGKNK